MEKYKTEYNDKGTIKYCVNFNKITSDLDAYFIGYMACDGAYVSASGYPFMSVSSTEEYLLHFFKDEYSPYSVIKNVGKKSSEKVNAINNVYELRLSTKMRETFKLFSIFDYKINRRVTNIPKKYALAYIRGVLDADGFVTVTHRKDCRTPRLRFFITHTSEKFLADIQNLLFDNFELSTTLRQHGPNVWRLQAQNTTQNINFLKLMILTDTPFNIKKNTVIEEYFNNYVPQASDELLEPDKESAAKL